MFVKMPFVKVYQKWDQHLLLNHPRLWSLRLPVLVVYFVVFNLLALLISSLIPLQTYHVNHMFTWLWIFGVVEVIFLVLWIRRFNWFSPEKALERNSPLNGLGEVVIYMLCILIFFSPTIFSSFVLENRYAHMIPLEVLEIDRASARDYSYKARYSQDLVEKYTQIDYETYLELKSNWRNGRYAVNSQIDETIHRLLMVTKRKDYQWKTYLTTATILLHLGVIMYALRHIQRKVLGKTILFAAGVSILLVIFELIVENLSYNLYRGNWEEGSRFHETIFNWIFVVFIAFFLFFSLRVFWQKRYRGFTAMNISLLPYSMFVSQLYFLFRLAEQNSAIDDFIFDNKVLSLQFGNFWSEQLLIFIFGSPLLILWVFILTKAMYTRLISLPEG